METSRVFKEWNQIGTMGTRRSSKGHNKDHGIMGVVKHWNTRLSKSTQCCRCCTEYSQLGGENTKSTQTELRSKNRSKLKTKEKSQEATSPREVQEVSTIKTSPLLHHCRLPLSRTLGKDGEVFAGDGRGSPPDQSNTYGRQTGLRGNFARMLCGKTPMKGFECLISIVITT